MIGALAAVAAVVAAPTPAPAEQPSAQAAFRQLSGLVGTWRIADQPNSKLRIRFSLTAGGTVLVEQWLRAGQPHSLTLYHLDGPALLATHYCPQGNQPRLQMVAGGMGAGEIRFAFKDAMDLDRGESYLHDLSFDVRDAAKLMRREVYFNGSKPEEPSTLSLVRE